MSESFRDKMGREWIIDLNIGTVDRVNKASRFNLWDQSAKLPDERGQPASDDAKPLCEALYGNYPILWELLWFLIEPQAVSRSISAEQFGEVMGPESLVEAESAFFREWHDFFHRLRRSDCSAVLQKLEKYRAAAMVALNTKLHDPRMESLDTQVQQGIEALAETEFAKALSDGSGKLRELLESASTTSPG